ncbi:hypothetical protein P167DRAFT_167199 [Morchella conica CCBAS932]|uniref:Uncharacterized protein n=1 Tax=Morchella conica CCBAS932 TaxID=1392247 RepID=A0A3N4KS00_9PEZI|nr:hypothetical protein P167DRAFT_167199 [Morchella conica CCBAS932]
MPIYPPTCVALRDAHSDPPAVYFPRLHYTPPISIPIPSYPYLPYITLPPSYVTRRRIPPSTPPLARSAEKEAGAVINNLIFPCVS